jgi:hypothetical protein
VPWDDKGNKIKEIEQCVVGISHMVKSSFTTAEARKQRVPSVLNTGETLGKRSLAWKEKI